MQFSRESYGSRVPTIRESVRTAVLNGARDWQLCIPSRLADRAPAALQVS